MKFDRYVNLLLEAIESNTTYSILPGGFKPPHKGHFEALKYLLNHSDSGIVYVGKSERDGITAEQSKSIWDVYLKYLDKPVDVVIAPITPVKSTYEFVDNHLTDKIIVGIGPEEDPKELKRYDYFLKHPDKYSNVNVLNIPAMHGRISGTQTRQGIADKNSAIIDTFVPEVLSQHDRSIIRQILGL